MPLRHAAPSRSCQSAIEVSALDGQLVLYSHGKWRKELMAFVVRGLSDLRAKQQSQAGPSTATEGQVRAKGQAMAALCRALAAGLCGRASTPYVPGLRLIATLLPLSRGPPAVSGAHDGTGSAGRRRGGEEQQGR